MGSRSRKKKERRERKEKIEKHVSTSPKALAAYRLYASNPIFRYLVDLARAGKYERENKPITRALQRAHAIAKFKEQGIDIENLGAAEQ